MLKQSIDSNINPPTEMASGVGCQGFVGHRCSVCAGYWPQLIEVCLRNGDVEVRCGECLQKDMEVMGWEKETLTGMYMETK